MRAIEFLKETDLDGLSETASTAQGITITIPSHLLKGHEEGIREDSREEETDEAIEVRAEPADQEEIESPVEKDELADIVRLSGAKGSSTPAPGQNHTIAAPAGKDVPDALVFISPLQQQLELQKQQGGKESPVINQIIDDTILGSTAGEQPEQSVYHNSPLKDNEWVGAGTGEVDNLANSTTTQGATKPWYKL